MYAFPDCANGLARLLDGAELGEHTLSTYVDAQEADYLSHLPAVVFGHSGEGVQAGPVRTEGVQVQVYADRFVAGAVANALLAWLTTPGGHLTPSGHVDAVRPAVLPAVLPHTEDVSLAVFTVLCDTRGEIAA